MLSPLKLALLQDGRCQWRIAVASRLTPTILSQLASGRRPAHPEERERLARVLGVPEGDLFGDECATVGEPRAA